MKKKGGNMESILKNRKVAHIGVATNDFEKNREWYINALGFNEIGSFRSPSDEPVSFLNNGTVTIELFQPYLLIKDDAVGKIDHIAFQSIDIEEDYKLAQCDNLTIDTDGIEAISTFWENGIRYFKIKSPTNEQIEFCQIL